MESFFSRYKNALVLIVVLVAQLLALAVQVKRPAPGSPDQQGVSMIRYLVVSVVTPPERWAHNIGQGIRGIWFGYLDLVHVRREDAELKAQIERLQLEQASLSEDAKQGQRLQQLLDFRQHYIYKTQPAQVIGASGTDQSRTLYIDKGAKDGLAPDMPVVTGDGIVGKLKDVFDHKSLVLLVSDPTSGVGVMLETTRTRGILRGVPFGQVQVINVSPDDRIKPGERIVTSGGDQIFPRGLPVGTVQRVTPDPERDPLVDVSVHPAANLSRLEEVLVITNLGDIPSAQAAKDLAESEAEGAAEKKRASDVLSERLPTRLDAKAPADTNPDLKAADASGINTADDVRLLTPPKPLRPDQYSPDSTPQAAEMTPGQRRSPVLQGTEDIVRPVAQKKAVTSAIAEGGETAHSANTASGDGGSTVKKTTATGSTAGSTSGTSARTTSTTPSPYAAGTTSARTTPSATSRPVTATTNGAGASSTASFPKSVRPTSGNTLQGENGGTTANSVETGPKPARPVTGNTLSGSTTTSTAGSGVSRPQSPATSGSASTSGIATPGAVQKTRVIVDGPLPAGRTAVNNRTTAPANTTTPANTTANPAAKKAPEIVPDDGSRPPTPTRSTPPKPKPAAQPAGDNSQTATPPNGGR